MKWFRLLLAVFLMLAIVLFGSPLVYANGGDEGNGAVVDISISGDPNGDTGGTCKISARREGSEINTMMFFSPDGGIYRDSGDEAGSHTVIQVGEKPNSYAVIDIGIDGHLGVDIAASGACELNVGVEGPWEVHIDAGNEVKLNVEASDESQVFVDDRNLDNPAQKPDESAGYQESEDVGGHSSGLNSRLPIISGAFLAVGLLAFFLIRRRAKRAESHPKEGEE